MIKKGFKRHKASALCHIEGGPDYEVTLVGDSSKISPKISTYVIDLGEEVRFSDWVIKEFYIENKEERGVTFDFHINLDTIIRKGLVDVQPLSGKIAANEKYLLDFLMKNIYEMIQAKIHCESMSRNA